MAGVSTTETVNEVPQPTLEFTSLKITFCILPFPVLPEDPLRQRRALFVLRHGRVPAAAVAAAPGGGPPHEVRGYRTVWGIVN